MQQLKRIYESPKLSILVIVGVLLVIIWLRFPNLHHSTIDLFFAEPQEINERLDTLHIYTFPNYFTDDIINKFEKAYNIKVILEYYDSNEEMLEELSGGKTVDLIVPTDYIVSTLIREGALKQINRSNLPNYANIDIRFRELDYDYANQYSIPYFWGSVGLTYNRFFTMGLPLSWNAIFDKNNIKHFRNRISIFDDKRMTMGIALISLGFSPNSTNEDEINAAVQRLYDILPFLYTIESENLEYYFESEDVVIAMNWSGSSAKAANNNRNMRFILPSEGSIFFVDNLAIPQNAPGKSVAYKFINFLLEPSVAGSLTNQNYFANTVTRSRVYVDRMILKGPAYKNPFLSPNIYAIEDLGEYTSIYQRHWEAFRDSANVILQNTNRVYRTEDRIILF